MKLLGSSHITHSSNYCSKEPIVINYFKEITFPYLQKKRKDLKLQKNTKVLLIFDVFKSYNASAMNDLLQKNGMVISHVLNNI